MNKRQKELVQYQLDSEKAVLNALEKQYEAALRDIVNKTKILQADIDMLQAAGASDDMALSRARSKIYQKQYQEQLKKQIEGILDKLHSDEFSTIQEYLNACYETSYIGTFYDINGQDVPVIAPIDQAAAIKAIQLDSMIEGSLYVSLGIDVADMKKSIKSEISRGIASSLSYPEITRNLQNVSKAPAARARTIVRTEGHRIQEASSEDARQAAKSKGADVVKQWDSTLDGKTRSTHRQLDGQVREVDEYFELHGMKARYPGDFGDPAEDCNCRCTATTRARLAMDENELAILKQRAEYFGLDKTKDFEDYKKKFLKASETIEKSGKSGIIKPKESVVKKAIQSGQVSSTVNPDKQNRHIKDSPQYIEGRSYIYGNTDDAQKLINALSGTGKPLTDRKGNWLNKERARNTTPVGVHIEQSSGKETETKNAMIIYSKTGSHIVPTRENEE